MSHPVEVNETFRPLRVVPLILLPHRCINDLNSRGQAAVHRVAELGSYQFISSILQALIVNVGAYIDLPRGGDLTMLVHLAARVDNEMMLTLCAYYGAIVGVIDLFGVSVQSLIDNLIVPVDTQSHCQCLLIVLRICAGRPMICLVITFFERVTIAVCVV